MRLSIANLATSISRENLLSLGTCLGKFTKTGKFRLHITALDIIASHARYKVWIKPNGEMPFLYGGNIVKAHIGRWSEDCPEHQGVIVFSMDDKPLGFGVTARSTAETRRLDPTSITVFRQADVGEYLREVDNFGASIAIFLEPCALKTVESVADPFTATYDAFILIVAKGAFIADANERGRPDITITDRTFAVTFVAQSSYGYPRLLSAHDEIATGFQELLAEYKMVVASAVIVPEVEEQPTQPSDSTKRRNSSISEGSSKRPRLASEISRNQTETLNTSSESTGPSNRSRSGQLEERKRGQRLFGALLGTLSQSSSSAANKRRTDIEKKQQAKLRVQAEEHEEQKKQRLDSLMAVRRKEQKKYDKQSMHIRHSNMLAQAHFLQTNAEPKLCYKPWELLSSEDARIKTQIEEAEGIIQREIAHFDPETAKESTESQATAKSPVVESTTEIEQPVDTVEETVGPETNGPEELNGNANGETADKIANVSTPEPQEVPADQQDNLKHNDDDGGEMVEADEDMVIY
ncbi:MAG: hypothetical protein Q9168_003437 [Polycauliona sp. 1 TL-2023]